MLNNNIINQINEVGINVEITIMKEKVMNTIKNIETELILVDYAYQDKLRDLELIAALEKRTNELLLLVNRINEIEIEAIGYKNTEGMFRCEGLKAKAINLMEHIRIKYMY